ncbi:MAG: multiheme c-type cytochrome [Candidatus Eisenbacteria bacterium]
MRAEHDGLLLVDAGDSFGGRNETEKRKAEVLLRCMSAMRYDACGIGENELNFGKNFLLDASRELKLPFVCANLVDHGSGKPVAEPYVIKKQGKLKVGIVGLLDDVLVLPKVEGETGDLVIVDAIETAKKIIPPLKKKVDLVVVLAHVGFAKSSRLANEVPEIDVMVIGHSPSVSMEARKEGNALLMMGGMKGQYVGYLLLKYQPGRGVVSYESKLMPLDGRVREQKLVTSIIDEYNAQEKRIREKASRRDKENALASTGGDRFLGAETCKRCHEEIYKKVAAMPHARAIESLEKAGKDGLAECLVCHTTGFGEPTGFSDAGAPVDLKNVQCEGCHGKGTVHKRDGTYRQVSEQKCLVCHTAERSPSFNHKSYLRRILH